MMKLSALLLVAGLAAGATAQPALAGADPTMPPFPTANDDGAAMLWLKRNTSLGVGAFVAFQPDNVLVVLTDETSPEGPALHRISFRQEATKVEFVARNGGRSRRGSGEVDCTTGTFRVEAMELFSGSDLRGGRVASQEAEPAGRVWAAGSAPAIAVAQVCGGGAATPEPLANAARRANGPRPAATQPRPALAPVEPTPEAPEPAASPTSPVIAQIGAFGSRAAAEQAWTRLAEQFPELMAGKTMHVDPVASAKAPMFRSAIGGFAGPAEARSLCARLMASRQSCFVRLSP